MSTTAHVLAAPTRTATMPSLLSEFGSLIGKEITIVRVTGWTQRNVEIAPDVYDVAYDPKLSRHTGLVLDVRREGSYVAVWLAGQADYASEWVRLRAAGQSHDTTGTLFTVAVG